MAYGDRLLLDAVAANTGVTLPAPADPLGAGVPAMPTVQEQINQGLSTLAGVPDYSVVATTRANMRNEVLRQRLLSLEARTELLEQLTQQLLAGAKSTDAAVQETRARLELVRVAGLTTQSQLEANTAADALLVARTAKLETQEAADLLADAAALAYQQKNDARVALLEARASQDEAAIAAALTRLAAAEASATQAINAASAAQSTASSASTAAATAQTAANAAQTTANANAANLSTVAADVATRLPAAAVQRFTVAVPGVTIQVLTPYTQTVTLPKAFASANYLVFMQKASNGLLNTELGDSAKTASSFSLSVRNTGAVSLAMPASNVDMLVILL